MLVDRLKCNNTAMWRLPFEELEIEKREITPSRALRLHGEIVWPLAFLEEIAGN